MKYDEDAHAKYQDHSGALLINRFGFHRVSYGNALKTIIYSVHMLLKKKFYSIYLKILLFATTCQT